MIKINRYLTISPLRPITLSSENSIFSLNVEAGQKTT
jgi:hypothetical protein